MLSYNKPFLSFSQQLQVLKDRGMEVTDDVAALSSLERLGYYRLSAYWYSLRKISLTQDPASKKVSVQENVDHALNQINKAMQDPRKIRLLECIGVNPWKTKPTGWTPPTEEECVQLNKVLDAEAEAREKKE